MYLEGTYHMVSYLVLPGIFNVFRTINSKLFDTTQIQYE